MAMMELALDETTQHLQNVQNATTSIARFEKKLIRGERHSLFFNVRLLGARDVADEDCIHILRDQSSNMLTTSGDHRMTTRAMFLQQSLRLDSRRRKGKNTHSMKHE